MIMITFFCLIQNFLFNSDNSSFFSYKDIRKKKLSSKMTYAFRKQVFLSLRCSRVYLQGSAGIHLITCMPVCTEIQHRCVCV